ncbi:MAG: esterase-like activity of phytase family protein [Pseudomonadota bacterium]
MLRAFGLAVALCASSASASDLAFDRHGWSSKLPGFGGLSGLELSADGRDLLAVTDRGTLIRAQLDRGQGGALTNIAILALEPLRDPRGAPLVEEYRDAEALAADGAGGVYVAFEFHHRIWHYPGPDTLPEPVPRAAWMDGLPDNKGVEALAYHPNHGLIAITETPGPDGAFAIQSFQDGTWRRRGTLPASGGFQVTGADFAQDGTLYIVERKLGLLGFRTRLRRRDPTGEVETIFASEQGDFDNLEAVSTWRDAAGMLRLTLLSDDNFLAFQRTEIIEFSLTE